MCEELALSPCENSCPLHMNIPRFLQLYKEERLEDAFVSVIMDNPLPASTGRVCQHPCDSRCRRQTFDEAGEHAGGASVHCRFDSSSDRFEAMVERFSTRKLEPTGRKIAIAGAGPAGLTAAFYLAMLGHDVTVFDDEAEAGGMLRFALAGISAAEGCAAPRNRTDRAAGSEVRLQHPRGLDISLNDLDDRFDAVFLSIGTWKESWVYLPGTELKGVYPALPFLESVAKSEDRRPWASRWRSSVAATPPSIPREPRCAREPSNDFLSPRTQGHAGDRRRDRRPRRRRASNSCFSPRRIASLATHKGNVKAHRNREDAAGRVRQLGPAKPILTDEV